MKSMTPFIAFLLALAVPAAMRHWWYGFFMTPPGTSPADAPVPANWRFLPTDAIVISVFAALFTMLASRRLPWILGLSICGSLLAMYQYPPSFSVVATSGEYLRYWTRAAMPGVVTLLVYWSCLLVFRESLDETASLPVGLKAICAMGLVVSAWSLVLMCSPVPVASGSMHTFHFRGLQFFMHYTVRCVLLPAWFAGSLGLMFRKSWARKCVVWVASLGLAWLFLGSISMLARTFGDITKGTHYVGLGPFSIIAFFVLQCVILLAIIWYLNSESVRSLCTQPNQPSALNGG